MSYSPTSQLSKHNVEKKTEVLTALFHPRHYELRKERQERERTISFSYSNSPTSRISKLNAIFFDFFLYIVVLGSLENTVRARYSGKGRQLENPASQSFLEKDPLNL